MKFKIILSALLSIIILTISCQKEINGFDPIPPSPVDSIKVLDSSYLDKVILLDENGVDTFEIQTFNYDVNKRLVLITDTTKDRGTISPAYTKYFYNGNDTLPYKNIYVNTFELFDSVVTYLFYDNVEKKIADSSIELTKFPNSDTTRYEIVTHYNYAGNKVIGDSKSINIYNGQTYVDENIDTAIIDMNGNILNIVKNRTTLGSNGANINYKLNYNYTYDGHTNPYFKLNILTGIQPFINFSIGVAKNNWLTADEPDTDSSDPVARIKYNFVYTYNSSGLPVTLKETITKVQGSEIEIYLYKYKAL